MSTVKAGSVFGNFKWNAEYELTREQLELIAPFGVLNIQQRTPSSGAEKAMAGYEKRPKGFKRTNIPFDEKLATVLKDAVSTLVIPNGEEEISIKASNVTVEEYFGSEQETKFTAERTKYVQRMGEGKGKELAATVGYDGELGDGSGANAPEEFLKAIRAWVKAQADKL